MILDSRKLPFEMKPTLVGEECTIIGDDFCEKSCNRGN